MTAVIGSSEKVGGKKTQFGFRESLHLISGIKKTQESDPLADFLRFLRRLGSGASGFSYQFSYALRSGR